MEFEIDEYLRENWDSLKPNTQKALLLVGFKR